MVELPLPPINESDPLVLAEAYPDERTLQQLSVRGETTLPGWLGGANKIWLGRPDTFDMSRLYQHEELDRLIVQQLPRWDFWRVRFTCGFRPAPECVFSSVSLQVRLEPELPHTFGVATAYQLEPAEVFQERTVKRRLAITPALTITLTDAVAAEGSIAEAERSDEYTLYEPRITTFGLNSPEAGWIFERTKGQAITGSRELFMVVRLPRGASLSARFALSATVVAKIGSVPLEVFRLSNSDQPLMTERYPLIPQ